MHKLIIAIESVDPTERSLEFWNVVNSLYFSNVNFSSDTWKDSFGTRTWLLTYYNGILLHARLRAAAIICMRCEVMNWLRHAGSRHVIPSVLALNGVWCNSLQCKSNWVWLLSGLLAIKLFLRYNILGKYATPRSTSALERSFMLIKTFIYLVTKWMIMMWIG